MEIEQNIWGFTPEGEAIVRYVMRNRHGAEVALTNLGAALVSVTVPDRDSRLDDVVLGYGRFEDYLSDPASMGKCVGRYAGRIPGGAFTIGGEQYRLPLNGGRDHVDGGPQGFGNRVWESRVEVNRVVFSLYSPDGDQGYPGGLSVEAVYDWDDDNALEITLLAKSEAPTVVNLALNPWFDLSGKGDVSGHELFVPAAGGTGWEAVGYDGSFDDSGMCYLPVEGSGKGVMAPAARLCDSVSGRMVDISTTQAAVCVRSGEKLRGAPKSKDGRFYGDTDGLAIMCCAQEWPDGITQFGDILTPDEIYEQHTIYRFSAK